jgi:hypothetical protein
MDPDENLAAQLSIAKEIVRIEDVHWCTQDSEAVRLAELVLALDAWIDKGGFLPNRWSKK